MRASRSAVERYIARMPRLRARLIAVRRYTARMPRLRARLLAAPLLVALALLASGCITRHSRQDVFKEGDTQVYLRADKKFLSDVPKGYDHPATISAVRVAHILSRVDLRWSVKEGNQRAPAIPTELLYAIATGISQALSKAGPDQEVIVMGIREEKRLGILDQDRLTSLIAYVRADKLYLHVVHSDFLLKESYRASDKPPQPRLGDDHGRFRLYGGEAMTLLGQNAVAVTWRDPIFKRATRTKILPTGEVKRKTILLETLPGEDPSDEDEVGANVVPPRGLSPDQLRDLADLEEARISGEITESEYRIRQQEILQPE